MSSGLSGGRYACESFGGGPLDEAAVRLWRRVLGIFQNNKYRRRAMKSPKMQSESTTPLEGLPRGIMIFIDVPPHVVRLE